MVIVSLIQTEISFHVQGFREKSFSLGMVKEEVLELLGSLA